MELKQFEMKLVHRVPEKLEHEVLYVCFDCNVVVHLCACGCGEKVVLPIDPDFWSVKYDGESISLTPSVGNFQFSCRSHYWIKENKIIWVPDSGIQPIQSNLKEHRKKKHRFVDYLKKLFRV